MATTTKTVPVKDGWMRREIRTGRLVEVGTAKGASKASTKTQGVLKEVAAKRRSALARLVDR